MILWRNWGGWHALNVFFSLCLIGQKPGKVLNRLMYQSTRSLNIPSPGHLIFWKIFVQVPHFRSQKAVQMPHHRSIPGDQLPPPSGIFSVAFNMLRKLWMKNGFMENTLTCQRSHEWFLNAYREKLVQDFVFQPVSRESVSFTLNASRLVSAMIYHATRNPRSFPEQRLEIEPNRGLAATGWFDLSTISKTRLTLTQANQYILSAESYNQYILFVRITTYPRAVWDMETTPNHLLNCFRVMFSRKTLLLNIT